MSQSEKQKVALLYCPDYARSQLAESVNTVLSAIPIPGNLRGARVLLKPNFVSSRGPDIACTNTEFLRTVAIWFRDAGARVSIGDSPAFGSTKSVMKNYGMAEVLENVGCTPVNFSRPVVHVIRNNISLGIAREALECDLLVNLPKLKAHNQMYITGAVKNLFGIVVGIQKAGLHMRHGKSHEEFASILLELSKILADNISVIDAVEAMHRSGPMDGDPLQLACIGGSRSAVALDTAMLQSLELPLHKSPLWRVAAAAQHPDTDPECLDFILESPAKFYGSGFLAPEGLNPIRFNPFRFVFSAVRKMKIALGG